MHLVNLAEARVDLLNRDDAHVILVNHPEYRLVLLLVNCKVFLHFLCRLRQKSGRHSLALTLVAKLDGVGVVKRLELARGVEDVITFTQLVIQLRLATDPCDFFQGRARLNKRVIKMLSLLNFSGVWILDLGRDLFLGSDRSKANLVLIVEGFVL